LTRRIAVLFGGRSSEHEVSVASARSVMAALTAGGAEVVSVEIGRDGSWGAGGRLPGPDVVADLASCDAVFPVLHGPFGEDGTVQGLLELAGVPYIGAGVTASAVAMDKDLFKSVLRDNGIPVTRNITLRASDHVANPFGYPVFVKPARLGSSVGISKAHDGGELDAAVLLAFRHDEKVLVEEFVAGTEVEVGVLGNRVPPPVASLPGQIDTLGHDWYDFESKYEQDGMELLIPPPSLPHDTVELLQRRAVESFVASECEGLARVDFFVRESDGEVVLNELNTMPGFTATSVWARLFEASGIGYAEALDRLIELALERHERRSKLEY
jgi:D-alanine-D-alanine ligase